MAVEARMPGVRSASTPRGPAATPGSRRCLATCRSVPERVPGERQEDVLERGVSPGNVEIAQLAEQPVAAAIAEIEVEHLPGALAAPRAVAQPRDQGIRVGAVRQMDLDDLAADVARDQLVHATLRHDAATVHDDEA